MSTKYCPHCLPTKNRGHFFKRVEYCLTKFFVFEFSDITINKNVVLYLLKFLSFVGLAKFESNPDRNKIKNRSYIFIEEAQKRNIDVRAVKFLNSYNGEYIFTFNDKEYRYTGTPLSLLPRRRLDIDSKGRIKRILAKQGLPISEGKSFWTRSKASVYGLMLGFPLVVKPNSGSLSHHVTVNIKTNSGLKRAIEIAKEYQPEIVVERYVVGNLYRATIIDQKLIYVCEKKLASVLGDGISTVKDLIDKKNIKEKRGSKLDTLQKIEVTEELIVFLSQQKLSINSVLAHDQKIILSDKYILGSGCEIVNVKGRTHQSNIEMLLRVAKTLGQPLIGLDFICPDITKPFDEQNCAIIEANSLPYLDMHQFPSSGVSENVAKDVWDLVFKKIASPASSAGSQLS